METFLGIIELLAKYDQFLNEYGMKKNSRKGLKTVPFLSWR